MPIGNSAYEPPTYNAEEEELAKFEDKVNDWWYDLDDGSKYKLLEPYYQDDVNLMDDLDAAWEALEWSDKEENYRYEHDRGLI